jgi:DNA-binding MarR family transcriptional regulator
MTGSSTKSPLTQELTDVELGAWRGFLQVHAQLVKQLDAELEAGHGLPLSSYEVLLFLANAPDGKMRMSELAERVLLSRSGLTRLVDRLEREGLVERSACSSDKRGWFASLTPEGRKRFEAARGFHLDSVRSSFLSRFSEDELKQLATLWERFLPDGGTDDSACG